jgi:hypothetical protein
VQLDGADNRGIRRLYAKGVSKTKSKEIRQIRTRTERLAGDVAAEFPCSIVQRWLSFHLSSFGKHRSRHWLIRCRRSVAKVTGSLCWSRQTTSTGLHGNPTATAAACMWPQISRCTQFAQLSFTGAFWRGRPLFRPLRLLLSSSLYARLGQEFSVIEC